MGLSGSFIVSIIKNKASGRITNLRHKIKGLY
jgi:hypothetical protein